MERVHSLLLLLLSIHQRIWFETGKLCAIYDLEIGSPNLNIEERRDATLSFFLSPSPSYERSSLCHQDKRNRTMILRIAINIWHCEHFIRCDVQLFKTHLQFSFHFISFRRIRPMICSVYVRLRSPLPVLLTSLSTPSTSIPKWLWNVSYTYFY